MPTGRLLPSGDKSQSQDGSSSRRHKADEPDQKTAGNGGTISDSEKKRVRGRIQLLRRTTILVVTISVICITTAILLTTDVLTRVFCAVTAAAILVVWLVGARTYLDRLKPYHAQLGLDATGKPAQAPVETRSPHVEADKRQAQAIARSLRSKKQLPTISSPVSLAPGEVCHHFRAATLVREAVGSRRVLDEGHLILTGTRLYFAGRSTSASITLSSITKLNLAGPRSFGVRYTGHDGLDTFDVEFPQEFLAYLAIVCHHNGVKLPRIDNR